MLTDADHDALPHRYTRPAESDKAPRQAPGRYRRRADDRACLAPGGRGRLRPCAGGDRRGSRAGRDTASGRRSGDDAPRPSERVRPGLRGRAGARSAPASLAPWSICRATCRRSIPPWSAPASRRSTKARPISAPSPPRIVREEERTDPNVVKVVGTPLGDGSVLRALYFTRATAPYGDGPLYHHIGIYAYRRRRAGALRVAAAVAARAAREIGAAPRARSRHAHQCRAR